MNRQIVVQPWVVSSLRDQYDAVVAAVGFEARSRAVAEILQPSGKRSAACAFPDQKELCYYDNLDWYTKSGYSVQERNDEDFGKWFEDFLLDIREDDVDEYKVAIDVSSVTRLRLAIMVDILRRRQDEKPVVVDFIYSIARFSSPPDSDVPNVHVGPVLKSFAGWSLNTDQPAVAIVGLGYEENKALGAVEHLQASQVWAFTPTSPVQEYKKAMELANSVLFDTIPRENRILYRAEQPIECFVSLESLTERCLRSSGVVLLPFGPKIFSVCALLVASIHVDAAVWRVSAGGAEPARNRVASEYFCGLRTIFRSRELRGE
jgi:hypothetical protein